MTTYRIDSEDGTEVDRGGQWKLSELEVCQ